MIMLLNKAERMLILNHRIDVLRARALFGLTDLKKAEKKIAKLKMRTLIIKNELNGRF